MTTKTALSPAAAGNIRDVLPGVGSIVGAAGGGYIGHRLSKKRKTGETKDDHDVRRSEAIGRGIGLGGFTGYVGGHVGAHSFVGAYNRGKFQGGPRASSAPRSAWSKSKVDDGVRRKAEGVAQRVHRGSTDSERSTAKSILHNMAKKHGFSPAHVMDHTKSAAYLAGLISGMQQA